MDRSSGFSVKGLKVTAVVRMAALSKNSVLAIYASVRISLQGEQLFITYSNITEKLTFLISRYVHLLPYKILCICYMVDIICIST